MTIHVLNLMYGGFQCARWAHPDVSAMLEVVAWALGVVERRRTFEIRPVDLGPVHAGVSSLVARYSGPHSECQMKKRCQRGHTLHPGIEPLFEYARAGLADLRSLAAADELDALMHLGNGLHNLPRTLHSPAWPPGAYGLDHGVLLFFDKLSPEFKWWIGRMAGGSVPSSGGSSFAPSVNYER